MRKPISIICKHCGVSVPITYKGSQRNFCTDKCRYMYKKENGLLTYQKKVALNKKKCAICKRVISSVNKRKHIHKYCSKKCMLLAQKIRDRQQKTVYVKIPIDIYKQLLQ